ncbi:hypothetical protein [Salinarimonas ramus]|uniref:Uncharacterized protein n=1 Tax=Salinarimonas ramus TaxID=690164 RepID=A0A917V1W3_9HYPH|nr:hypothetical protein [Salinarimonas ramus]GGK17559.1 hypothetical protein GCM10011322_00300 [Salinarimonas ramus]
MDLVDGWYHVRMALERALDDLFALDPRAFVEFDSVVGTEDMEALGYVRNFPHLTCLMCSLPPARLGAFSKGEERLSRGYQAVDVDFALLPAACYKIYLGLRGRRLDAERVVGCIAKCFRHEDKPLDAYRAVNFTMKEYVHLGSAQAAQAHLEAGAARIDALMRHLGLAYGTETASDPFFDATTSVAVMSRLMPTKREIVYDGHAVSSLNYHRNYFGDKFDIRLGEEPVHTSCVAFGIERWMAMLAERFGEAAAAEEALRGFEAGQAA